MNAQKFCEVTSAMKHYTGSSVPMWEVYEIAATAAPAGDPFAPGAFGATFRHDGAEKRVPGFYDGDDRFVVRFMPEAEGEWTFETDGAARLTGRFECTAPLPGIHGPSRAEGLGFRYADGARCLPYGTTCYAWAHQPDAVRARTLEALKAAPFNKLRMCVFPKYYRFNRRDPAIAPFEVKGDGFDEMRPNPAYFRWIEQSVEALSDLDVIADVILFHPYDRWGYATMSPAADERYLRYVVARLSAYRHVWWAMANEYDLFEPLFGHRKDWRRMGELVRDIDPYGHPRSNHNCLGYYDHSEAWVTHCSLQRIDVYRHVEDTQDLLARWNKPVVWDEIAYEGNIPDGWGSITGAELTRRCWESMVRGGYPGHAETILLDDSEDAELWWSHGGELRGESPARIAFLRRIHEQSPEGCAFWQAGWDLIASRKDDDYYLFYHSLFQPLYRHYPARVGQRYRVEIIDTWNMTIEDRGVCEARPADELEFVRLPDGYGYIRVELPGRPYMAVRMTRAE